MHLSDIDYELPEKLIAQHPVEPRDSARLLVAASPDQVEHKHMTDLVDMLEPGDVLVVGTNGFTGCAVTGDLVLGMAKNSGAVGFVTDGCVRDMVGLKSVGLPAWSMGVTPNSPHRNGPGTIGMPVNIAGHVVRSGDIVVADLDGVVIIPTEELASVLAKLPGIRAAEMAADESVRQGARLPDFLKT